MGKEEERRHFIRIPMDSEVHLNCDGRRWQTELIDISMTGALVSRPAQWAPSDDTPCRLEITLSDDITITMEVVAAHEEADYIGFRCTHIGLESISHLKRLVELNLGDHHLLERELHELVAG